MPTRPPRPCSFPGCPVLVPSGSRCHRHAPPPFPRATATVDKAGTRSVTYGSARWARARRTFLDHNPLCARCAQPATDVDHEPPHDGTPETFWDETTWQPLCRRCHLTKTAKESAIKRGTTHTTRPLT